MIGHPQLMVEDFCETGSGGTPSRANKEYYGGNIPWVKSGELREAVITDTQERITERAIRESNAKIVPKGSILLAMYGATVGRMAFLGIDAATNQAVCSIRPDPKRADSRYVFHCLQSRINYFLNRASGGAQPNISQGIIKETMIPLPPLEEQRRIAAILDRADALRRKRKRAIELLECLTESMFLERFGDPIENTAELPVSPLEDVVSPSRRITYGILKPGPDKEGGVPYVRVVDIQNSLIKVAGLKRTTRAIASEYRRSTLRTGDLLISIRGHVGRMAIVPPECDGANITQDTARLAVTAANTEFVKALLETTPAKHWMMQRTKGAAVKGINLGDLRQFPLILPPKHLQDEFAEKVSSVRTILERATSQNDSLVALFSSLQHRAFSGQL